MATIQRVAQLAGVSTATVSRALAGKSTVSPATRKRVEEAARELGYVASATASGLASGRTRNVGMVVPFVGSWYYQNVLKGAHRALADAGYDLTLYHLEDIHRHPARRRRLFDEFLMRKRVDAFLAVSLELTDAELTRIRDLGKPMVGVGGPLTGVTTLSVDDRAVAALATSHLTGLGHRRIGFIGAAELDDLDFHMPAKRRHGYDDALIAAGVEPDPGLRRVGEFTLATGYRAAHDLLTAVAPRPTAIFAVSDEMAIGTILAARDLGLRVPEDLSVIGIDGHEMGEFFGLTTIDQHPVEQGRLAALAIVRELADPDAEHEDLSLPYELVVRTSTAAPPADA